MGFDSILFQMGGAFAIGAGLLTQKTPKNQIPKISTFVNYGFYLIRRLFQVGVTFSVPSRSRRRQQNHQQHETRMQQKIRREDALDYHAKGRPGKLEVVPTKEYSTQRDLSLAYSPGVAEPCLAIEANPDDAFKYTAKGNLVAVISNGTAVLGLGQHWPCRQQTRHGRERLAV